MSLIFPELCVVDTNVPINANLATNPDAIPDDLRSCVQACVEAIDYVVQNSALVIDSEDVIFEEYLSHLSLRGQPGMGDVFLKWIHDNRWKFSDHNRVVITACHDTYVEFPDHPGLTQFDISDRKFVAVANAHPNKPAILQATDSKWWGWKEALQEVGISVCFLCPEYAQLKFHQKMGGGSGGNPI